MGAAHWLLGIDYERLGRQTAEMAHDPEGEKPDMPVESQKDMELLINMSSRADESHHP